MKRAILVGLVLLLCAVAGVLYFREQQATLKAEWQRDVARLQRDILRLQLLRKCP